MKPGVRIVDADQQPYPPPARGDTVDVTVTRCGFFAFEGFGRPWEGWVLRPPATSHRTVGRAFTRRGAIRKALRFIEQLPPDPPPSTFPPVTGPTS